MHLTFFPALALGPIVEHLYILGTIWPLKFHCGISSIIKVAIRDSFFKLSPQHQIRNPVMFTVYIGSLLTSGLFIQALIGSRRSAGHFYFGYHIMAWFTLLFANFAEAMAEGRGKAQAQALRKSRREIQAKKLAKPTRDAKVTIVQSA